MCKQGPSTQGPWCEEVKQGLPFQAHREDPGQADIWKTGLYKSTNYAGLKHKLDILKELHMSTQNRLFKSLVISHWQTVPLGHFCPHDLDCTKTVVTTAARLHLPVNIFWCNFGVRSELPYWTWTSPTVKPATDVKSPRTAFFIMMTWLPLLLWLPHLLSDSNFSVMASCFPLMPLTSLRTLLTSSDLTLTSAEDLTFVTWRCKLQSL